MLTSAENYADVKIGELTAAMPTSLGGRPSKNSPPTMESFETKKEAVIAERARENQGARNDILENSTKSINTRLEIAKAAFSLSVNGRTERRRVFYLLNVRRSRYRGAQAQRKREPQGMRT